MRQGMRRWLLLAMAVLAFVMACPAGGQAADQSEMPASSQTYRAIWFAFYDYDAFLERYSENTEENFKEFFDEVLDNCKEKGFNRILVHVRPAADAVYASAYYPVSARIAGKQGAPITYDPLKVMVAEAHGKGMAIEAWLNPYRVASSTDYKELAKNNPARRWHESQSASEQRNVLEYDGRLYFNPSKPEVRELIINGAKEIVRNYDVDGIHLDDYFYPSFTMEDYRDVFDAEEYNHSVEKEQGMSIQDYRREQVNLLVFGLHAAVKNIRPDATFGISPAGNIDNLTSERQYYVDIEKWCSSTEYVDYITPQIYWGFHHTFAKYDKVLDRWSSIVDQSKVKLYIGLPAYRMGKDTGSNPEEKREFKEADTLKKMIKYAYKKKVDGFAVFDYQDIVREDAQKQVKAMAKAWKK